MCWILFAMHQQAYIIAIHRGYSQRDNGEALCRDMFIFLQEVLS